MRPETDPLAPHRSRLLGLAYRMLGSRSDAEDVVQDAYLRFAGARGDVDNTQAYLVTIVTRLCLDRLRSAQARREVYVGPWLPEPVFDAEALSPAPDSTSELADDLSFALLLALDRLSPAERAAFLLHDIFETPFPEIARILARSEESCRKLASRARQAIRHDAPPPQAASEDHARLLTAFLTATATGDLTALTALLRADAIALTDGGGSKRAALRPIHGADRVARFFVGLAVKLAASGDDVRFAPASVNGKTGVLVYLNGTLDLVISCAIDGERIAALYAVRNPDKLRSAPQRASPGR
ncbi:RNA polymerase sigma factor SigJ [Bradyrhizobium sp. U87765 SZCCT0131]|uniref:RNA polymerase sigma factor SigJ n=1 Tax=unclassified Bradyrhizobium TaxID=2631580 RepID=UPI001BADC772|nr:MULTISPECIES: RNA polymerase sigma factor SigJ [unclassified Bradyrhizobium]MBR1223075.1 RNA polymerase sigma factor SigJ [Bradyrhizobium sp. U87765 SZCCT0131]MBR1265859.1 RNA polymerase sigma factor SigJ [Bradyrhizobium sp. U87765 SZCCT0134]MBR1308717.1 RNA polymerase sigma factor SigJ [Bradyrhizobium sp. U87765 SZCCT0110]MBR1318593.1 RNA polymerase sigma factor SigJ [Bradyrhizobium sp. U87765 SZCCT0109]MBR1352297.1 RNA polymerase sigma factor SigJ [Bradyrhizobium sp. U87765 SZCCT0048]